MTLAPAPAPLAPAPALRPSALPVPAPDVAPAAAPTIDTTRKDTRAAVRLETVPSACPVDAVRAHHRVDPFWESLWSAGSQASWVSEEMAHRQVSAGLGRLPDYLDQEPADAWRKTLIPKRFQERLDILGVLDSWRTVTAQQLAAFTGNEPVASGRSTAMRDLFAMGLSDTGIFMNGLHHTRGADRGTLYRPSRTEVFRRELEPLMSYPEWVRVTGGYPFESGGQFDRHNLLTSELVLRVAEYCEIATVLGEKLSSHDLLAHSGLGRSSPVGSQHAADATLVRSDGARIAIELTASAGPSFDRKVRRWASLLANRRMSESGLMVVFVIAERPDKKANRGDTRGQVLKNVARAAREIPGVNFDRVAERIFVADWTSWFPEAGMVNPSFFALDAWRPTGGPTALWEPASLLDVFDCPFEPADPAAALAVADNASMLASVPFWLRTGTPPELWEGAFARTGWDEIPVPAPSRPEMYEGRPFGEVSGLGGCVKPPRRLRTKQ